VVTRSKRKQISVVDEVSVEKKMKCSGDEKADIKELVQDCTDDVGLNGVTDKETSTFCLESPLELIT
jgi:hypothetical protein